MISTPHHVLMAAPTVAMGLRNPTTRRDSSGSPDLDFTERPTCLPGPKSWLPNVLRRIQDAEPNRSQRV
jgi:hypothetical protein